jgi:hypothetical protein
MGEWYQKACPICGHPELDVHLHGGVSCPECGWEGEWEGDGLWPDTAEEAAGRWPEHFPSEWRAARAVPYKRAGYGGRTVRLAGFYHWSADIHELAQKEREKVWNKLNGGDADKLAATPEGGELWAILEAVPDQGYKLMEWAGREWKRLRKEIKAADWEESQSRQKVEEKSAEVMGGREFDDLDPETQDYVVALNEKHDRDTLAQRLRIERAEQNLRNLGDLMKNAAKWLEYARTYNVRTPDFMSKEFDGDKMHAWVNQMREQDLNNPKTWKDSKQIYRFPDGWYIAQVGPDDLEKEGKIMQHCVGGLNYINQVRNGDLQIFSLREPNGQPHVTMSLQDRADLTKGPQNPSWRYLDFPEIYGKQDAEPIPEYQERIDQWWNHLRDIGWNPEHSGEYEPPEPEHEYVDNPEGDFEIHDLEDLREFADHVESEDGRRLAQDDEGEYDDMNNTYYYARPSEIWAGGDRHHGYYGGLYTPGPYLALLEEYLAGFHNEQARWFAQDAGYDLDDRGGAKLIKDLWYLLEAATNQRGGAGHVGNVVWPDVVAALDRAAGPPAPQATRMPAGEGLFDPSEYQQGRGNPVARQMAAYARALSGMPRQWEQMVQMRVNPQTQTYQQWLDEQRAQGQNYPNAFTWEAWRQTWPTREEQQRRQVWQDSPHTWPMFFAPGAPGHDALRPTELEGTLARVSSASSLAQRAFDALHTKGGFSLLPDGREPEPGYYVAEDRLQLTDLGSVTPEAVQKYFESRLADVRGAGAFFGGWVNSLGEVYLETSRAFDHLADAARRAAENGEQAVWDGWQGREVPLSALAEY